MVSYGFGRAVVPTGERAYYIRIIQTYEIPKKSIVKVRVNIPSKLNTIWIFRSRPVL